MSGFRGIVFGRRTAWAYVRRARVVVTDACRRLFHFERTRRLVRDLTKGGDE